MKPILIGTPFTVMENPYGIHSYFGWPTVARTRDGKIVAAASGYRLNHICPFGKAVIAWGNREGTKFAPPTPIIDTHLDDRDAGLCPFGESGLILTSFNNTRAFQRKNADSPTYSNAYLDKVSDEAEAVQLGATFRVSLDNGFTWGPLCISPITSPHGPVELSDRTILWVGRRFSSADAQLEDDRVEAHRLDPLTGKMTFLGAIPNIDLDGVTPLSCEPHAIELEPGHILCHIRVQGLGGRLFTTYQSESLDGGVTWSAPRPLLEDLGGAPAHLYKMEDGRLFSVYGYRSVPYGIRVMFSEDGGKTWDTGHTLYTNPYTADLGYPATIALEDGSFLTVFYAHPDGEEKPSKILGQIWKIQD